MFFLLILYHFDVLISKINFKKLKKIISIHFQVKNSLKNNYYHITKQTLMVKLIISNLGNNFKYLKLIIWLFLNDFCH